MRNKLPLPLRVPLRANEIGLIFSSHGLGGLFGCLGMESTRWGLYNIGLQAKRPMSLDAVLGRQLSNVFLKLGPTFIKLGQILASRPDFVGDKVSGELRVLLDNVPPVPFSEIQDILIAELGEQKTRERFQMIDPVPLACGSLAQTHRATLNDGTLVILKVQKRGIAELVQTDLVLFELAATSASVLYPKLDLRSAFRDFKAATLRELDYLEEARNIDKFKTIYGGLFSDPDIIFPGYFRDLTTSKVLTLEPLQGRKVSGMQKGSTVARKAAAKSVAAVLEQIFEHGFFHADPHAGNLFFLEDSGKVGFIDMGLVGQLRPDDKEKFLKVLVAVLRRDRKQLAKALYDMGSASRRTNYKRFETDINALIEKFKSKGANQTAMEPLIQELLGVARKHKIKIPNRYLLMLRSCLIIEGVARSLDPDISLLRIAAPILTRSYLKSLNPITWLMRQFK